MIDSRIRVYHALPPKLRFIAASARGWQLRRWRYGPETQRFVDEALERESWTPSQWRAWQAKSLAKVLHRAATHVPYFRRLWENRSRTGFRPALGSLAGWPLLRKESLRADPTAFLADDSDPGRMWCEHTSGTTGTPLTLWQSRQTVREWYALFEARWRGWYGLSRHDRWAIIGGQLVTPVSQKTPPYWVWNAPFHQLYLSAYHLAAETASAYVDALHARRVTYLLGYPSALSTLAGFILEHGLQAPTLRVIISNAEPLHSHQREIISKAFRCPVHDTYGMSEMVCAASECEHGRLHLWPETGIIEVLRDDSDEPVGPGEAGRLVATGLLNRDMPLIRYEVGDRIALAPSSERCPCGRTLPILRSIEGRIDDLITTPDGRRIGRLDPVFKADFPIREGQVVQTAPDQLILRIVPAAGFDNTTESKILWSLRERVANMRISVEKLEALPRSPNGKLKAVVSLVSSTSSSNGERHIPSRQSLNARPHE